MTAPEPVLSEEEREALQDNSPLAPGAWCPGCGSNEPCPTRRALAEGDS